WRPAGPRRSPPRRSRRMACRRASSRSTSAADGSRPRSSPECSARAGSPESRSLGACSTRSLPLATPDPEALMPNRIALDQPYPLIAASDALWERARGLIPAGTQTLAKGPGQYVRGVAPKYLARGRGARVWDADGNEFLDMSMGIGPLVLGYADRAVDDAIRRQLDDGITFSLMHPLEVELAETLRECIPNAESVRFAKSGAEATSAAIRVARAFTGRARVLCCGYHGWHDWYISVTDRHRGVPEPVRDLTFTFDYNNLESLARALDDDTAC